MTTRGDNRRTVREGLDALISELGARDAEPEPDFALLTPTERAVHDELLARAARFEDEGLDAAHGLARLSYDELCQFRALERRATNAIELENPRTHEDLRDTEILATINSQGD